jgi:hypothetical protein
MFASHVNTTEAVWTLWVTNFLNLILLETFKVQQSLLLYPGHVALARRSSQWTAIGHAFSIQRASAERPPRDGFLQVTIGLIIISIKCIRLDERNPQLKPLRYARQEHTSGHMFPQFNAAEILIERRPIIFCADFLSAYLTYCCK